MSCSNCYNGCTDITSDKCVKYTGVDIPLLGIQNGDSMSYVTSTLIGYLSSTLDGTGIVISLPDNVYCSLITGYLPSCGPITALNLFEALIKSACNLQDQITTINTTLSTLNASYTVGCLSGVDGTSKTHDVVQAIITKLCLVDADLTALALDVSTNYVKLADLDGLIAAYLASIAPGSTQQYLKMVPYTVVEYYGSLSNFDGSGAGISGLGWDKIYLCNGNNGTPDKRGRIPVGVIQGVGGGVLNPNVDPAFPNNPNYTINMLQGVNAVALTSTQIPPHTHAAVSTVTDPGHYHLWGQSPVEWCSTCSGTIGVHNNGNVNHTSTSVTGITVNTVNSSTGGGLVHTNIPPVLACYYIIYLP